MTRPGLEGVFADWKEREALSEGMIPLIGDLYRRNVVIYIYGKPLFNESVIEIMKTHRFVQQIEHNELSEFETYPMLEVIAKTGAGACPYRSRQDHFKLYVGQSRRDNCRVCPTGV